MVDFKKRLRAHRHRLAFFSLAIALLLYSGQANADGIIGCTRDCFSCSLSGFSYDNEGGTTIFDDGAGNYYTDGSSAVFNKWNCGDQYLLRDYVTYATTVTLQFAYTSLLAGTPTGFPPPFHDIIVTNLTSGAADTLLDQPDSLSIAFPDLGAGEYQVQYYEQAVYNMLVSGTAPPGSDLFPDITGLLVLIKPVSGVSITAPPICPTFNDSVYVFQLHTYPTDIPDLLFDSHSWGSAAYVTPAIGCGDLCLPENYLNIDFSESMLKVSPYWNFTDFPCQGSFTLIPGFKWTPTAAASTDVTHYYVPNSDSAILTDLASYLINNTETDNYGQNPVINVTISDGINTYTSADTIPINNTLTLDVDINTRCAPGYTASAADPTLVPQYSVTPSGGTSPYTYLWSPTPPGSVLHTPGGAAVTVPSNGVVLDSYTVADPKIIARAGLYSSPGSLIVVRPPLVSSYILTVTDAVGCADTFNVHTPLDTAGFDLASRDSHADMYDEPNEEALYNPAYGDIWHSPDIWNRYDTTGIANQINQSPEYADSGTTINHLYVEVRNVGCSDYSIGFPPALLKTYWTMGGFSGETWDSAWNGTGATPAPPSPEAVCDGSIQTLGDFISSGTGLPPIPAGSNAIIMSPWTPPNPRLYYPLSCTTDTPYMELCFLSRIVDYHDPVNTDGMSIQEVYTGAISSNVRNNNNIATLNTSIAYVHQLAARRAHMVVAGNGGITAAPFSLQFVNSFILQPGTGISKLHNYVSIKVYLGDLYDIWQQAGGHGTYTTTDANEKSVTFDGTHTVQLDSILLPARSFYPVKIEFDLLSGANGAQMPNETINFRQLAYSNITDKVIDTFSVGAIDSAHNPQTNHITYDTTYSLVYDTLYKTDNVYGNYSFLVVYQPSGGQRTSYPQNTGNTAAQDIKVYPNPANSALYFVFPASDKTIIKLMDISGRITDQQAIYNGTTASFKVSNYTPGIYLYQVVTGSTAQSGKVLIEK